MKDVTEMKNDQVSNETIVIESMKVDFGCSRRRDRDRDRDRDGGLTRPINLDLTNLTEEEIKTRVEYSF